MSYLEELTRDQFLSSIANQRTRESYETALNQFDEFCKNSFEKNGDVVITDLRNHIKEIQDGSGVYRLLQSFVNWLNEDHPELSIKSRNHSRPMTKRHPSTIKHYVSCIKQYVEEFGNIDIIDRKYQKRVKIPKKPKEELEPFTRNEIRDLIDHSSFDRKVLYMTLKDSGMRIGEAVQIRKCHVDLTKNPVEIHVPANITKTKTSRTTFVTRETAPMLRKRLEKIQDNDLVFGKNDNPKKAVVNEEMIFKWYRDKLGMTDRYESNNRHKKNLHSLRAFTSTQIADVHGEEFAPQVQQLRELRDSKLLQTESGSAFMKSFNDFYYSFSPVIADYERENPVFREAVKLAITPMISSLSILNHVDMETDAEVLGYGISLILLNIGMYVGIPAIVVVGIRKKF